MPIYLYKCNVCSSTVEKIQPIASEAPRTCTSCGSEGRMEKQISAPAGFKLKGTGWYQTDFKNR